MLHEAQKKLLPHPGPTILKPSETLSVCTLHPRFAATSFEDFAIPYKHHLSNNPDDLNGPLSNPVQNTTKAALVGGLFHASDQRQNQRPLQ